MIYFYWVMFGVLAAGLGFILQLGAGGRAPGQVAGLAAYSQVLMLVALVGAGVVHLAFYSRWLRLRRRYNDCFAFMTGISTFYVQRFERDVPEIGALLAWQPESAAARQPLSAYVVSVYSLLPLLSGVFFGAAVVVGGEMWLGVNGGALFPIPINATLLGAAGGVVVLALALVILAGRMAGSRRASRTPVLGDI